LKRVVFLDDLKESDIRPEKVYDEYKRFLSEDVQKYFCDPSILIKIDCPGCSNNNHEFVFNKMGFNYRACNKCGTFFVSPRPAAEALRTFYKNSTASLFLRKNILENTSESRSKQIFSYRIQWIMGLVEEYSPDAKVYLDYATKYPALLRQLNETNFFKSIISAFPECYEQEHLLPDNINITKDLEVVKNSTDVFAAFEVVERTFDPGKLFNDGQSTCKKNGLFIITSTTASGFEYQVLGEYSPNVFPPDRLNLLSLEALMRQIEKAGFKIIEVSTPGRLDVEMVKKTYEKNPDIPLDPFWKYLFRYRNENALHSLQEYLQQFQLSSHVRIAAIKK
jgi:ribosomal protein S27E